VVKKKNRGGARRAYGQKGVACATRATNVVEKLEEIKREDAAFVALSAEEQDKRCEVLAGVLRKCADSIEICPFMQALLTILRAEVGRITHALESSEQESKQASELEQKEQNAESEQRDSVLPRIELISYGIGKFSLQKSTQIQFAAMMVMAKKFLVPAEHLWIYDPVFSSFEKATAKLLGFSVISKNEECRRVGTEGRVNVFYMPHCGKTLYSNLIASNWGKPLERLVLIGNSLSNYASPASQSVSLPAISVIDATLPYLTTHPVSGSSDDVEGVVGAFNDTAVHTFASHTVQDWNPSPVHDTTVSVDPEVIPASMKEN